TVSGEVKLTDFGIVYIAESTTLTGHGMVLGTADYIAPEQVQGLPLTPASDLYSLGVVLFEMLVGALPFTGTSIIAVARKHLSHPVPSLRLLLPELPKQVEQLVRRALAKNPERRFRSASEMEAALRTVVATLQASEMTNAPEREANGDKNEGAEGTTRLL